MASQLMRAYDILFLLKVAEEGQDTTEVDLSAKSSTTLKQVERALDLVKDGVTAAQLLSRMPDATPDLVQDLLHQGVLAKGSDGVLRLRYTQVQWRSDGTAVGFDTQLNQRFCFVPIVQGSEASSLRRTIIDGQLCDVLEYSEPIRTRWLIPAVLAAVLVAVAVATVIWLRPLPPLYVAVLRPETIEGTGEGPASAVRSAAINTLTNLREVYAISGTDVDRVGADPATVARAVGADEALITRITSMENRYQVEIERISGTDRLASSFDLAVVGSYQDGLASLVDLTRSHIGMLYRERPAVRKSNKLTATSADYARFAAIRQKMFDTGVVYEIVLDELTELRKNSPGLVDVYRSEAAVARYLFQVTADPQYKRRAEEAVQKGLQVAPDDARVLMAGAELAIIFNDQELSEELYQKIQQTAPLYPKLWWLGARNAEARGDITAALEIVSEAIEQHPTWSQYQVLADIEMKHSVTLDGSPPIESARAHLYEAIELAPQNHSLLGKLGELELRHGSPQAARAAFHEAASIQPSPSYLANLGTAALLSREYDEAINYYQRAMARGSRLPAILLNLADAYLLTENQSEANKLYMEIIGTIGDSANPHDLARKAVALARLDQADEAVALIEQTLAATDAVEVLLHAATVYAVMGDYQEAARRARTALAHGMNPTLFNLPWFEQLELDQPETDQGEAAE